MSVPSYLAAVEGSATSQLMGGLGGEGRNRIGLKGARFRLVQGGQEIAVKDESYLDVVILGANAAVSRTFYAGKYDPAKKAPPDCFSPDGVASGKGATSPQSAKCATCKQNEKGSKIYEDGTKGRACSFSKRLAVMLVGDADQNVYQLDAKALSVFGEGIPAKGLYTLAEYSKLLGARGVRAEGVVTRISFDTNASVPKLFFTPQSFVGEAEFAGIAKLAKSKEVKDMLEVSAESVDLSGEVDGEAAFLAQPPAHVAAIPAPKATPAPVVEPAPAPAPAPKPAAAPVAAQAMDEDLAGLLDDLT
jgi:hypothetical protein